jgi:hypothetical protein
MNLMVLAPAVFPNLTEAMSRLWIFNASCLKHNISPTFYGIGNEFPGYRKMKLEMQLEHLRHVRGKGIRRGTYVTHILYTDAWDAFFTRPLRDVIKAYQKLGSPPFLASAYIGLGNESDMSKYKDCFDETIPYRYPNVGGYLAEIGIVIQAFESMLLLPRQTGDDCFNWYDAWREGWFRPKLDSGCDIFQVSDDNAAVADGVLINRLTGSMPCILHLCGGYTDPRHGKDDRMKPWARRLGVIE